MSDFNLPDNCTGEMVDEAHGEPDRDRVCMWCRHCIEECCDMGLCERKLWSYPESYGSWRDAMEYVECARVDMQTDTCANWREWR